MTQEMSLLERLKARGEEVFGQISGELMANPQFMKAVEGALRGKQKLEEAVGHALKTMNVPTRSELRKALARIEALEREVVALKAKAKPGARPRRRGKSPRAAPRTE
ncbi:MAG TPA: poly(R)-hydroxyalkanoic acid synthase subunit PhaE [Vicinamibacteria bacterium]|nr:poly(R)-hydroxyalkanoic acid synthase subunit PhaE [Vicinamibacteria bacterium]